MLDLHRQIYRAVQKSGLSSYAISEKTGIDQAALSRFFSGQKPISLKKIYLILDALGYELTICPKNEVQADEPILYTFTDFILERRLLTKNNPSPEEKKALWGLYEKEYIEYCKAAGYDCERPIT